MSLDFNITRRLRSMTSGLLAICAGMTTVYADEDEEISFNKHIRPIFIAKCTKCHGGAKAKGDLSLIYREEALGKGKSGKTLIVPGKPMASELFLRIITDDLDEKMPLQKGDHAEPPLPPNEVAVIKKWIEQGAEWESHWAYSKPTKHDIPELENRSWVKSPMDSFVLVKIESEGLTPTAEADRAQWLRRASFDIIGLPPTSEEVASFVADTSADAFEKQVDRLLASQHFGERWAAVWMDLARYADTMGYEKDGHRDIWPYRDYVIRSFNADKPYDLFLQEQLAGDLMSKPSSDQILATAFHRNTQTNTEGGTDDEEYRVAAIIDRVNTTWTATQGITFGCIQCHAHPYEPIPHEDYYRFYAFFNSTEDVDLDNDYPHFTVANDMKQRDLAAKLYASLPGLRAEVNKPGQDALHAEKNWKDLKFLETKTTSGGLVVSDGNELRANGTLAVRTKFTITAEPIDFTAFHVKIIPETEDPAQLPERGSVLSHLILHRIKPDGKREQIALNYVFADTLTGPYDPVASIQGGGNGFGGYPKLFGERDAVFVPAQGVKFEKGDTFEITIHHAAKTTGNQACTLRRFKLTSSNDPRWTDLVTSQEHQQALAKYNSAQHEYNKIKGIRVPVTAQRPDEATRETRLFIGGLWLNRGDLHSEGVPQLLNAYNAPAGNRLEMAKWLTSSENPLTSRVMANRVFAELFGRGIVNTLGDFGSTGVPPTNLPLLDHLAMQFQGDYKWSVKSLVREIVLSAAYRQNNKATAELAAKDPANLILARGPRNRLSAEMIRDNALVVSGLFSPKTLGASVMPPQPDGIWQTVYSGAKWETAKGANRYRRALYTYWKRTSPYPSMITFDAPSRDVCSAQRIPTNTPLHALVTLNDPVYLECSQALAKRMQEKSKAIAGQISFGYFLATNEEPNAKTVALLTDLHDQLLVDYQKSPENVKKLHCATPEEAARTVLANTILNLDAALTK